MPGPEGKACWGRGRSIVDEHISEAKIKPRELERWLGCEEHKLFFQKSRGLILIHMRPHDRL